MIENKRVLALIPARGGSRRLPGKNVMPFKGRPLIAWSVAAALGAPGVDRVVVSTDDEDIANAARTAGAEVPFMRPAALSDDAATSVDVALHALDTLGEGADVLLLLQPTSPLRTAADIEAGLRLMVGRGAPAVVGVTAPFKPLRFHVRLAADGTAVPFDPGDEAGVRLLNGAFYAVATDVLRQARTFDPPGTLAFEMPQDRSIDIDTAFDWRLAEALAP
ncbi:acylneuraminate cytidylyltransferase family protein [Zavarzinia compransoris]|uniref:acylneuraminate cytidylyltransferase family protein n=1 Tax=Zavarzinia marina TaxID=2911065 RepID=UPI001F483836|nr:acylneuraminate cytidylyltransferase family protein [Zavarzinia marina]MCF4166600.1 acylneuraminate cytidylyltransferase family protein [Zavarzinia marina]